MKIIFKIDSILVFVFSFLFYLYYQRIHPLFGDEFNILVQARRVIEGQVPYRDFFQFITPGSIYITALWLKIFGNNIWSIKIFSALESSVIALLVYLLIRKVVDSKVVISIVILFTLCFCTTFWPFVSHHWLSTIPALIALYFMAEFVEKHAKVFLFLAGIFAGFTFIVLQNKGGLIFLALLLFMVIDYLLLSRNNVPDIFDRLRNLFKDGAILFTMFLFLFFVLIVYLFSQDALGGFIYDTFLWVTGPYKKFNAYPNYFFMGNYSIYKIFTENPFPRSIVLIRDLLVIGYLPPVLIALSIFYSIGVLKKKSGDISVTERQRILFVIAAFFMFLSILYRSDIVHITFVFPFVLVLLGILLDTYIGLFNSMSRLRRTIFVLMISFFLFYGFYGAVSRLRFASNVKYSFDTRIGRFYTYDKSVADFYDNLFRTIDEKITDDNAFVYLWSSFVYFISGKKNPTGFDSVIPGYNTDEQLRSIANELEEKRVNFIVYDGIDEEIIRDPYLFSYPMADIKIDNVLRLFVKNNYDEIYEVKFDKNLIYKILKRKEKSGIIKK